MGHRGKDQDGLWAYNNLQAQVDFGYRGAHVAAVAGKAIAERYYGHAPKYSYFHGCSTGGRQAMVEAQRFPWDFDGILGGGPWINDSDSTMAMVWGIKALRDKDGHAILTPAELRSINEAVLAKCDLDDGVKDGTISNPRACKFDPAELACGTSKKASCLNEAQINAVRKLYAGPTTSTGIHIFPGGVMPGFEKR
jgi:feruloyl esterase